MRTWIDLVESAEKTFFHGSDKHWEPGSILSGRGEAYEKDWSHQDFYRVLEKYRPSDMLSHRDSVFMWVDDNDLDMYGGGEWVLELEPLGTVERHDMNWSGAIIEAIDNGEDEETIAQLAENYWDGIPTDDPLWEYLTPKARVIRSESL